MSIVPSDPIPYALFIARHLMMPVDPADPERRAAAETEAAIVGDRWFWTDDNAKVLSFLAVPQLLPRFAREVGEGFDFLASLCRNPFVLRRTGHPRLETLEATDGRGRFFQTFLEIRCDLPKGIVSIGMRFHDGRDARNLILSGNYVQFTHQGQRLTLDVEDAISRWDIAEHGPKLVLRHASELDFEVAGGRHALGTLWYEYTFAASSMSCDVRVRLELDSSTEVSDVVLTISHDDLSHGENNVNYGIFRGQPVHAPSIVIKDDEKLSNFYPTPPLAYWSIAQLEQMSGFALGVHNLPAQPEQIVGVRLERHVPSRFHCLSIEHAFPGRHRGGTLVVEERKWISSGGFYDRIHDYMILLGDPGFVGSPVPLDPSISYDYGAELEAFARGVKTAASEGMAAHSAVWRDHVRGLYDMLLGTYWSGFLEPHRSDKRTIFSRPLSFVALSLCDMIEATGEQQYREHLGEVIEELLLFRRDQTDAANNPSAVFCMNRYFDQSPHMDCHSAALCALARAYPFLEDERILAAIDAGLASYVLGSVAIEWYETRAHDVVGIDWVTPDGSRRVMEGHWNYKGGLTLRAFDEILHSPAAVVRRIGAKYLPRLRIFDLVLRDQLCRSLRPREDALEILSSVQSTETNSETQPWVALGVTHVLRRRRE